MHQLFIFMQNILKAQYQRHDIDVSIDVIILNSKILITLMTLMLTNELYPSRLVKNNFIGHRIWR